MKIWLPIKLSATGGSSSFAHKFKQGMEQHGHQVFLSMPSPALRPHPIPLPVQGEGPPPDYDVLLVSPRAPLPLVYRARQQGKLIIHRLDGAYYPTTPAGWLFPVYNAPLTAIQYLSHHTIYQSQYASQICRHLVGPRSAKRTSIILNGVDTDQFTPDGPHQIVRQSPDQPIFFTAQQFRRRDQIEPLVQALAAYQERHHHKAKLVVAGDFIGEAATLLPALKKNPSLQLLGPIGNDKLPEYLRAADAFLYCHPNPACPNNVLEAMACGLPVVGINDGAMPELVRHEQDGYLVSLPGNGHLFPRRFNPVAFADAMHQAIINKPKLGQNARERVLVQFPLNHMIKTYQSVFDNLT